MYMDRWGGYVRPYLKEEKTREKVQMIRPAVRRKSSGCHDTRRKLTADAEASSTTVGDDGIVRHGLFPKRSGEADVL